MAVSPLPSATVSDASLVASGQRVLQIEREALASVGARIGSEFAAACRLVLASRGRVVATGMGKSGHVARKIAATLASTRTPALFVQPG
ncbi:D-arabinose 5-phosphate isomerase, partial [Xanthomonas perforans]